MRRAASCGLLVLLVPVMALFVVFWSRLGLPAWAWAVSGAFWCSFLVWRRRRRAESVGVAARGDL